MLRKVLSVVALASVTAVAANAQTTTATNTSSVRPFTIGIKAGASIPVGDLSDVAKTGFIVGGQLGFKPAMLPVWLRADVDYNNMSAKGTGAGHLNVWGFTGNVGYDLPVSGAIKPYGIAGLGAFRSSASNGGGSSTDFGFQVGGGVKMPLSGFNTFIEARYTRVSTDNGSSQFVPVYFGVSL